MGDQIYYFGYAKYDENTTGFFEFAEHTPENIAKHYKFRTDSAQATKDLISPEHGANKFYTHNAEESFDVLTVEE